MSNVFSKFDDADDDDIIAAVVAILPLLLRKLPEPTPQHTSVLTGRKNYYELIEGNENTFQDTVRMNKQTFHKLLEILVTEGNLKDTIKSNRVFLSVGEKLMIFMHILAEHTNRYFIFIFSSLIFTDSYSFSCFIDLPKKLGNIVGQPFLLW